MEGEKARRPAPREILATHFQVVNLPHLAFQDKKDKTKAKASTPNATLSLTQCVFPFLLFLCVVSAALFLTSSNFHFSSPSASSSSSSSCFSSTSSSLLSVLLSLWYINKGLSCVLSNCYAGARHRLYATAAAVHARSNEKWKVESNLYYHQTLISLSLGAARFNPIHITLISLS